MSEVPDSEVIELATKVFDLARQGETETLAAYLDAGVPADLTNDRGDTLVMLAAYHGHAATVEALLARGAEPDRANDRGQTPLAGAVFKGRVTSSALCWTAVRIRRRAHRPRRIPHECSGRPTCWSCSTVAEPKRNARHRRARRVLISL